MKFDLTYHLLRRSTVYQTGVSFQYLYENGQFSEGSFFTSKSNFTIVDTLDVYYEVIGTDTITRYNIKTQVNAVTDTNGLEGSYRNSVMKISVPFAIGIRRKMLTNVYIRMLAGVSVNFLLTRKEDYLTGSYPEYQYRSLSTQPYVNPGCFGALDFMYLLKFGYARLGLSYQAEYGGLNEVLYNKKIIGSLNYSLGIGVRIN